MIDLKWIWTLLAYICLQGNGASSIQVVSKLSQIKIQNSVEVPEVHLSFFCNEDDFVGGAVNLVVQSPGTGSTTSLSIQCSPAERRYLVFYQGVVIKDGQLYVSETPSVRSLARFSAENATEDSQGGVNRVLLQTGGEDDAISAYPGVTSRDVRTLCAQFTTAKVLSRNPSFFEDCVRGPSASVAYTLQELANNATAKLEVWLKGLYELETNRTQQYSDLAEYQKRQTDWTGLVGKQLEEAEEQQRLTREKTEAIRDMARGSLGAITHDLELSYQQISNGSRVLERFLNSSSRNADILQSALNSNFLAILAKVANFSAAAANDDALFADNIGKLRMSGLDASSALSAIYRDTAHVRLHNANIQEAIARFASVGKRGSLMYPFSFKTGSSPLKDRNAMGAAFNNILIGNVYARTVAVVAGVANGVLTRLQYRCDSVFVVDSGLLRASTLDFLDWLGPTDCNPDFAATSGYCKCLIRVSEQRCALSTDTNLADSVLRSWLSNGTLIDASTGCLSPASAFATGSGGVDGTVVTSPGSLSYVLAAVNSRTAVETRPVQIYEGLTGLLIRPDHDPRISFSNYTLLQLAMSGDDTILNFPYCMFALMERSYEAATANLDAYEERLYGSPVDGVDMEERLGRRVRGGVLGRSTEASVMMTSSEYLTLSLLKPSEVVSNIVVTVNGTARTVQGVFVTNPYDSLLPGTEGIIWDPQQAESVWYDIPVDDMSMSGWAPLRCFHLTYTMMAEPEELDLEHWRGVYGDWEPQCASNVPSSYQLQLDSNISSATYGQCITAPAAAGGPWCSFFSKFSQTFLGTFDDHETPGLVIYSSRHDRVFGSVVIPDGELLQIQVSACPLVDSVVNGASSYYLTFRNPFGQDNLFRITQGPHCPLTIDRTLAASSDFRREFFVCKSAPSGESDVVTVYYFSDGAYHACPNATSLPEINSTTISSLNSPASLAFTYTVTEVQNEVAILEAAKAQYMSLSQLSSIVQFSLAVQSESGIRLENSTLENYNSFLEEIRASQEALAANWRDVRNITLDLSLSSREVDARFERSVSRSDEIQRKIDADWKLIADLNAALESRAPRIASATAINNEKLLLFTEGIRLLCDGFVAAFENRTCDDSCWQRIGDVVKASNEITCKGALIESSRMFGDLSESLSTLWGSSCTSNFVINLMLLTIVLMAACLLALLCWPYLVRKLRPAIRGKTKSTTVGDSELAIKCDERMTEYEELLAKQNLPVEKVQLIDHSNS